MGWFDSIPNSVHTFEIFPNPGERPENGEMAMTGDSLSCSEEQSLPRTEQTVRSDRYLAVPGHWSFPVMDNENPKTPGGPQVKKFILTAVAAATIAALLFFPAGLTAQQATTSLNGVVTDSSGGVVPGASVTITRGATGQALQETTNGRGEYQFSQLAPGTWTVTVKAKGFADQSKVGNLLVSQPATIAFTMSVQAVNQTVNVSAETETLNTSDASLGDAIGNRTIQSLPMIDRNVPDLLSLQPGVLYLGHIVDTDSDSRTGTVNGVRSDQDNVTMDGLDDNDQRSGYCVHGSAAGDDGFDRRVSRGDRDGEFRRGPLGRSAGKPGDEERERTIFTAGCTSTTAIRTRRRTTSSTRMQRPPADCRTSRANTFATRTGPTWADR